MSPFEVVKMFAQLLKGTSLDHISVVQENSLLEQLLLNCFGCGRQFTVRIERDKLLSSPQLAQATCARCHGAFFCSQQCRTQGMHSFFCRASFDEDSDAVANESASAAPTAATPQDTLDDWSL